MKDYSIRLSKFNHDRLKNGFVQDLVRLIRSLQGRTNDKDFVVRFYTDTLLKWPELEQCAKQLTTSAEEEARCPSKWFFRPPLDRVEISDREWMAELLSHDGDQANAVRAGAQAVVHAVDEVTAGCKALLEGIGAGSGQGRSVQDLHLRDWPSDERRSIWLEYAVDLHRRCQDLSAIIYEFSDRVCSSSTSCE